MKHSKTGQNKQDPNTLKFSEKIDAILETKFSGQADTSLMKKQILDVLDGDKNKALFLLEKDIDMFELLPESLKHDPEIIKIVIKKDPQKFISLNPKTQESRGLQETAISSIVRDGGSVISLIEILEICKKKNKKLLSFADSIIGENPGFLGDETNKYIYEIYQSDPKLFILMQKVGLFSQTHSGVSLGSAAAKHLAGIISELEGYSPEEIQNKLYLALLEYLGVKEKDLGEPAKKLLLHLVASIAIKKKKDETTQDDEQEESKKKQKDVDLLDDEDDEDDETHYSVGPYSYIPLGNTCRVWDNSGVSVAIEKNILESMSEKSLENFMNFSLLMKNLGLDFLITKQHRLSQLVTGVSFYDGDGMTQGRTLKFLNSVGKNIGIPEESYEDSEGNKKTGCFQSLDAAKMRFRDIKSSGNIGKLSVDVSNTQGKSVVEIYMKHIGLLTQPYGELSVAKWK